MWVGRFRRPNWYKVGHGLEGKMRQMRQYVRGIETVSHFTYIDSFVGLFE